MARRNNECRVDAVVTVDGRLIHALVAATRNARSPSDDFLVGGTTSAGELDDLIKLSGLHSSDLLKHMDMNCQQICKISRKRLNGSENILKSFRGATFFETPC